MSDKACFRCTFKRDKTERCPQPTAKPFTLNSLCGMGKSHSTAHYFPPQLSSLVQIGKTGRPSLTPPLRPPVRPPRSLACGEAAPPLPDSAKEVA